MPRLLRWLQLLYFLCAASLVFAQPNEPLAHKLSLNQAVTSELRQTQRHLYELQLQQGQFLQLTVTTQTFIPILTLLSSDEKKLREAQFIKLPVAGKLYFQIAHTGLYKVAITPEEDLGDNAGIYELSARATTVPTTEDLAYARGLLLIEQYWPLLSRGTTESLDELLRVTDEALKIWRALGDRPYEAVALYFRAEAYKAKEQFDPALETFQQSLLIQRELGVPARIAGVLNPIGQIYAARSEYQEALKYYLEALPLYDPHKYENTIGWSLTNIGHVYNAYGELTKALEYYQRSYARYDHYTGIAREKHTGMGVALGAMANVYRALGDKQKALEHLTQALAHFQQAPNPHNEHLSYVRMGEIYTSLGEYTQAELHLQKAQRYFHNSQSQAEADVLRSLGQYAKAKGDYARALEATQVALTIRRKLGNRRGQAQALTQLGAVYASLQQWDNSLFHYTEAQLLWQEVGDKYSEGSTLNYLGRAYAERNDVQQARAYFNRALVLQKLTNDREGEANTRYQLARLEAATNNFTAARQHMDLVLAITESVRATVSDDELRASYLTTVKDYYEFYVDLLMQLHRQAPGAGHDRAALEVSEMARARTFSETLANTHRQLRQGVPSALLKREAELQQRLNAKAEYQRRLINNKAKPALLDTAASEIHALTTELQTTRAAIKASRPRSTVLAQPQPLSVTAMQQTLLDENTLLLVYALGPERSYLWVISPTSLSTYELPKREHIETAARRVYELLVPQTEIREETPLQSALAALSQMVIVPARETFADKRLLIVADGALQYIPFAALPESVASSQLPVASKRDVTNRLPITDYRQPLIANHEIINLPSINVLAGLRREMNKRPLAAKTIAVFADPVFTGDDARLLRRKSLRTATPPDLEQALRDIGESNAQLPRLPFTRREANSIIALVPQPQRRAALDFAASRTNALDAALREYRILHFATHGILNSVNPELSGLVLSLVDERGRAQDGFFRLHEIYNLQLNAELVVLSACQSGLGKEVKGEGLIGLTRGFMYAGAPRVIASLWKVNDKATSELMKQFYQNLLGTPKHSPAAALRTAQIALLNQKRWAHPSYWAAFTLQGEWR